MLERMRPHFWGLALGAVAFAVSAALILSQGDYEPLNDSAEYSVLANRVLDGEGFTREPFDKPTALRAPLYPLFLAGALGVSGRDQTVARLATAALGGLVVVLLYLLVFSLWGRGPALLAGALTAVSPALLVSSTGFFTEPLFLVLELAALLAALSFRRSPGGLWLPVLIGVLCGLAALTRTNGILLLLPIVPVLGLAAGSRRRALAVTGVTLLATCITLVPWTVRNESAFGRFIPFTTQAGYSLIFVFNDQARAANGDYSLAGAIEESPEPPDGLRTDEAEYGDLLTEQALDYARDHPGYVAELVTLNTLRTLDLWSGSVTGFASWGDNGLPESPASRALVPSSYVLYALAFAGLLVLWRLRRGVPWFLVAAPVILVLSAAFTAGAMRYRVPIDPLLLALAGLALADLGRRLGWRAGGPSIYDVRGDS